MYVVNQRLENCKFAATLRAIICSYYLIQDLIYPEKQ